VRTLTLSWEYPPIVEGGLARHVRKLNEALVRQSVESHVLTRGNADLPADRVQGGVRVHRVHETSAPRDLDAFVAWVEGMNADMLEAGARLVERFRPELVHGHDWLVAPAAAALAELVGVPFVSTIHATEHGRHNGWVDKHPQSYIHGVETWMAERAERLVACSHYMQGHVSDVFGVAEDKVAVIPNGIDPTDLRTVEDLDALRAQFAEPDEKLILLVGRLTYEKGFQLALEAMPTIVRRVKKVKFLVAGSGPHEDELKAQVRRLRLGRRGTFLGWIGDDVLHSLYRIADLCVVPSLYEPFGLVALEAMASDCPCIVADTGGLREVVPNDDVGLRFRSRDPRSLATMVERVLTQDDLRDSLVAEARTHIAQFDWADVASRTLGVYRDALAGAAARPASARR
jgi:glycogen(starch) synthase